MAKKRNERIGGSPDDMDFFIVRDKDGKVIKMPKKKKKKRRDTKQTGL